MNNLRLDIMTAIFFGAIFKAISHTAKIIFIILYSVFKR